jgi:hypothetical protein
MRRVAASWSVLAGRGCVYRNSTKHCWTSQQWHPREERVVLLRRFRGCDAKV